MRGVPTPWLAAFVAAMLSLSGCNEQSPLDALERIEREGASGTLSIRPGVLSADDALRLALRLEARKAAPHVVALLRFVHHSKRGDREAALAAVERSTDSLAKEIAGVLRDGNALAHRIADLDLEEGMALRRELELRPLTDCELQVQSGQFKPLTGPGFCTFWDSGILELLPSPARLATGAARAAALRSLAKLPREQLAKVPRTKAIMANFETRRAAVQQEAARQAAREEAINKKLVDLVWKVTVEISRSGP